MGRFCTNCGWPTLQPSPYNATDELAVSPWSEAALRDWQGRPLAYELNASDFPGRAWIPGTRVGAVNKVNEFPSDEGLGARRASHIYVAPSAAAGAFGNKSLAAVTGKPISVSFSAGRIVLLTRSDTECEVIVWDIQQDAGTATRKKIPPYAQRLLSIGWTSYVVYANQVLKHDGLTGAISQVFNRSVQDVELYGPNLAVLTVDTDLRGNSKTSLVTVSTSGEMKTVPIPFIGYQIRSESCILGVVGTNGEVAMLNDGVLEPCLGSQPQITKIQQVWLVNGQMGYSYYINDQMRVTCAPAKTGGRSVDLTLRADSKVSIVPGKSSWEEHLLVVYAGLAPGSFSIYKPGSVNPLVRECTATVAVNDGFLAFVRRNPNEDGVRLHSAYISRVQNSVYFEDISGLNGQPDFQSGPVYPRVEPIAMADFSTIVPCHDKVCVITHDHNSQTTATLIPYI